MPDAAHHLLHASNIRRKALTESVVHNHAVVWCRRIQSAVDTIIIVLAIVAVVLVWVVDERVFAIIAGLLTVLLKVSETLSGIGTRKLSHSRLSTAYQLVYEEMSALSSQQPSLETRAQLTMLLNMLEAIEQSSKKTRVPGLLRTRVVLPDDIVFD